MSVNYEQQDITGARDAALYLGGMAAWFARVDRATVHDDGRRENNSEHSFMLSFVAPYIAGQLYPNLNPGLIAQYCTVHDLAEAYVGDTPTFGISKEDRIIKERREAEAVAVLLKNLPSHWADLLQRYEDQKEPEARLVRVVDKMMPAMMHIHGGGKRTFAENYDVHTREEFYAVMGDYREVLREEYPEFGALHDIRNQLIDEAVVKMFGDEIKEDL